MVAQFARAPHRGATSGPTHTAPNAALLIDFDNVTMGIRSDLSKELKHLLNSDIIKGKVAVQRAYADWRRYQQYIVPLAEASVDLIFAPAYGSSKKNATDIRLAIDALELVFTRPEIGTFILLSGDSDFSSLVLKLKEYGKYVIGVGIRESASDLLVQNCDEYYSYSVLSGLTRESDETIEALDPWVLAEKAVRHMAEQGDVMRSDRLKQVMLEMSPGFNEKDLGYSKFSKFLSDAVARGYLHLKKADNGQWDVTPVDRSEAPAADAEEAPQAVGERESRPSRSEGGRSRGRGRRRDRDGESDRDRARSSEKREEEPPKAEPAAGDTLAAAYDLLRRAVANVVGSVGGPARDSDVKRRMLDIEPSWDESTLGFSKFSRFLRQAHDAEVVDLQKAGSGMYEVLLPHGKAPSKPVEERRVRTREKEQAPAPREATETKAESEPTRAAEAKDAARDAAPAKSDGKAESAEATAAPSPAAATPPASTGSRSALGIGFRRGTRGRSMPAGPPPLLPGQAVARPGAPNGKPDAARRADVADTAAEVAETATEVTEPKAQPAEKKSRRSRGRGRSKKAAEAATAAPAEATGAEADGVAAPAATVAAQTAPELAGLPADAEDVLAYLANRYKGVGKKTAEAMIEVFGAANVFQALHGEPDRVREALGGRRADTLLAAWQSDLEQRRAEAAAVVQEAEKAADEKPARKKSRSDDSRKAKTQAKPAKKAGKAEAATGDEVEKKSGGRSRSRRGGRKRTKPKVEAGS